jgi:hypothetical protein
VTSSGLRRLEDLLTAGVDRTTGWHAGSPMWRAYDGWLWEALGQLGVEVLR